MTLVLKGIDNEILKETTNSIGKEIIKSAPFAKIDDIYVMEKTRIIKVRFRTMATADKIKESGLRLFWFSIPSRNIEYERHTNVPQCIVCYSYNHIKNECPHQGKVICSGCAQEGHIFRECQYKSNLKCISCGESHRTLSAKCKIRKEIAKLEKEKTTKEKEKNELPYNLVAKKAADAALKEATITKQIMTLPNDLSIKVLVVLINAHLANIGRPGTYAEEVKKGLQTTNLPEVDVSNDADSALIFQVAPPPSLQTTQESSTTRKGTHLPSDENQSVRPQNTPPVNFNGVHH